MVVTKRTEHETDDPPAARSTEEDERDLAAEDIAAQEPKSVKAAMMVCGRCGAQLAVPEP